MQTLPLRLSPGVDVRRSLEAAVAGQGVAAAFVLCGIGSLGPARLRLAGAAEAIAIEGDVEILTLSGSVTPIASHLHASLSLADGRVIGGHMAYGCSVRTTAELLLSLLPDWRFSREPDAATGFDELVIRRGNAPQR